MAVTTSARMAHALLERLEAEGKLDEGLRYEVLNGELVIRGAPQIRHERVVSVLLWRFVHWTSQHGGEAFSGVGIELGGQQLVPDVSFVGPERAGELDPDGFHVAPDLVVEVTSPGTRSMDLHEKRIIYQELGVAEYWIVDLAEGRVLVHRLADDGAYHITERISGTLTPLAAPGLEVPVTELVARD